MPPPQSVNEVKAAIAAAARSDGSLRIVQQQQPQRRAGFAGGEGVEGEGGGGSDFFKLGHGCDALPQVAGAQNSLPPGQYFTLSIDGSFGTNVST